MYLYNNIEVIHEKEDLFFLIKENIYNKLKSPTEAKEILDFVCKLLQRKKDKSIKKENSIDLITFKKIILDLLKDEQVKEIDFMISHEYLCNLIDNLLLLEDRDDTIIEQIFNSPYLENEDKVYIHNLIEYQIDKPYVPNFNFNNLKDLANNFNKLNLKKNNYSSSPYLFETIKENRDITNLNKKMEEIILVLSEDNIKDFNMDDLKDLKLYYLNLLENILQDKFLREGINFKNIEKSLYELERNINYSNSEFIKMRVKKILNYYFLFPTEKQRLKFENLQEVREFLPFVDINDLGKEKQNHLFSKLKLNLNKQNYEEVFNLLKREKILNPINQVFLWFNKKCNFDIKTDINYKKFFNFLNLYSDIIIENKGLFEFISNKLGIKESLTDNSYIYNLMFKNLDFNNTFFIEEHISEIKTDIENGFYKSSEKFDNNLNLLFLYYSNVNLMNELFINDKSTYKELTELLQETSFIFKDQIVKPSLSRDFFLFYENNINKDIEETKSYYSKNKDINFKIDYVSNLVKFKLLQTFDFDDEEVLKDFNYNQKIFEILVTDFSFLIRDKELFLDIYKNCNSKFLTSLSNKINKNSEVEVKLNTEIVEEIVENSKDSNNFVMISIIESLKTHNLYKKDTTTDVSYDGVLQEIKKQGKEKGIKFNF